MSVNKFARSFKLFFGECKSKKASSIIIAAAILSACGGSDSPSDNSTSEPTQPTQTERIALGEIAANVKLLSASENAALASQGVNQYKFSTPIPFRAGEVVLGESVAFKVVSSEINAGETIIQAKEPAIEELFSKLRIKGSFNVGDGVTTETPSAFEKKSELIGEQAFKLAYKANQDSIAINGVVKGSLGTDIDYDFDLDRGGLIKAAVGIKQDIAGEVVTSIQLNDTEEIKKNFALIRVPISISLVDKALGVIGVRLAAVQIPFYFTVSSKAKFETGISSSYRASGLINFGYSIEDGETIENKLSGSIESKFTSPKTPAGTAAESALSLTANLGLGARPSLVFLNQIIMAGVDASIVFRAESTLYAPLPDYSPDYCLLTTPFLDAKAYGFFKAATNEEKRTGEKVVELYKGDNNYAGTCLRKSIISLMSVEPEVGTFGKTISFVIKIEDADTKNPFSGKSPTGKVTVRLGEGSCDALLVQSSASTATGQCSMYAQGAGQPAAVVVTYSGDTVFAPNKTTSTVKVNKANSIITLMSSPKSLVVGEKILVNANVTPDLDVRKGQPTGSVHFTGISDKNDSIDCTAQITDSGTAGCELIPGSDGIYNVVAIYLGDKNFNEAKSASTSNSVSGFSVPVRFTVWASVNGFLQGQPPGADMSLYVGENKLFDFQGSVNAPQEFVFDANVAFKSTKPLVELYADSKLDVGNNEAQILYVDVVRPNPVPVTGFLGLFYGILYDVKTVSLDPKYEVRLSKGLRDSCLLDEWRFCTGEATGGLGNYFEIDHTTDNNTGVHRLYVRKISP